MPLPPKRFGRFGLGENFLGVRLIRLLTPQSQYGANVRITILKLRHRLSGRDLIMGFSRRSLSCRLRPYRRGRAMYTSIRITTI